MSLDPIGYVNKPLSRIKERSALCFYRPTAGGWSVGREWTGSGRPGRVKRDLHEALTPAQTISDGWQPKAGRGMRLTGPHPIVRLHSGGRPTGPTSDDGGSSGSITAQSTSIRSLAKRRPSRPCCAQVVAVHIRVFIQFGLSNPLESHVTVTTQSLFAISSRDSLLEQNACGTSPPAQVYH